MELKIDDFFQESYKSHFDIYNTEELLQEINGIFTEYDPDLITDVINIIKTSIILNLSYSECFDKVIEKIHKIFPVNDDIDKFVLKATLKVMISQDPTSLESLLIKSRDIEAEVAAKYFKVPVYRVTNEMKLEVLKASDNFTKSAYSVTDPPVESWDEYFYNVCRQVARNSKCLSRRIGAVLVKDKGIVSTGYNGPPRGIPRCDKRWKLDRDFFEKYKDHAVGKNLNGACPRHVIGFVSGQGLEICPAGHAERNALINAARDGISTKGSSLYMTCGVPCTPCLVEIINAGVSEIVVTSLQVYDETSKYLLRQGDLDIRLFNFIK